MGIYVDLLAFVYQLFQYNKIAEIHHLPKQNCATSSSLDRTGMHRGICSITVSPFFNFAKSLLQSARRELVVSNRT